MARTLWLLLAFFAATECYSPLKFVNTRNSESFQLFRDWQTRHGKTYVSSSEEMTRYRTFMDNIQKVAEKNARRESADDARFDLTQFADLSAEEFKSTVLMTSYRPEHKHGHYHHHHHHHTDGAHHHQHDKQERHHGQHHHHHHHHKARHNSSRLAAPDEYDWTEQDGIVTSVKNQGRDGTCWAFAGAANVESLWAKKTGSQSPDLSTQALNDCDGYSDPYSGAIACGPLGATMPGFYYWVIDEGGMMTWEDYPYCSGIDECSPCAPPGYSAEWCGGEWPISPCHERDSCDAKYDKSKFVDGLKVTDFTYFDTNEENLKDDLVETGPLVAGIDASDLQLYSSGVLKPDYCSVESLNHAVLLVGYGQAESEDFWKAKNSWGTSWGEDGFFRIQRGVGACGINADISSVVLG